MKTKLDRQTHLVGTPSAKGLKTKTSAGHNTHPYLRIGFYQNPTNQFWERPGYSESARRYFREANGIIKQAIVVLLFVSLTSCTDNQRARNFGGTETINLAKGQKLVNATWKKSNLWYLTEPMPIDYVPQTKTFIEQSNFGMMEGKVIFVESR